MSYVHIKDRQQGIALLGAMVVALILSLLGATLLNLAGQETVSAGLASQTVVAHQLADAAGRAGRALDGQGGGRKSLAALQIAADEDGTGAGRLELAADEQAIRFVKAAH